MDQAPRASFGFVPGLQKIPPPGDRVDREDRRDRECTHRVSRLYSTCGILVVEQFVAEEILARKQRQNRVAADPVNGQPGVVRVAELDRVWAYIIVVPACDWAGE